MSTPTRPILRYFGGKWRLAPWIISHFPPHNVYVEPFCGAASVFFRKPHAKFGSVLNDINGEIVNLFLVLRDLKLSEELLRLLRLTPFARDELVLARIDDVNITPVERARRLIVRSQLGRGSCLLRDNTGFRGRRTNSTYPAVDWMNYPDALTETIKHLQGITIENLQAGEILKRYDGGDVLFYVDPPYPHCTRRHRDDYAECEMSNDKHRILAQALHSVSGMVVLSGYRCDLMDELYADWERKERQVCNDGQKKCIECIWLSSYTKRRLEDSKMETSLFCQPALS
mgnify:CR=1 FL=1